MDAGFLEREVLQVGVALEVDLDAGGLGAALVVEVHEVAAGYGGDGAADAEGDEAEACLGAVSKVHALV